MVVGGDQVGQAGPVFHEPMLAGPDPLVVLHMTGECTQDDRFHNLYRIHKEGFLVLFRFFVFGCFFSMKTLENAGLR